MKNKILSRIFMVAMVLFSFLSFSPAQADCGKNTKLIEDPNTHLCIPLNSADNGTINDFVTRIINILLSVAAVIAILFIIIGGFMYITSAGNAEQAEKGRATLVNAVIGLIIIILAYVIVGVVNNAFADRSLWNGLFG
jgi:hypothetical protein